MKIISTFGQSNNKARKGDGIMKQNYKQSNKNKSSKDIFGVHFHKFMEQDSQLTRMEMAQEFGISLKDVKKLKENIDRS